MATQVAAIMLFASCAVASAQECSLPDDTAPAEASSLAQLQMQRHSRHAKLEENFGPNAHDDTLCANGRLLPELYVLGAQKSATTEFAGDLISSGVLSTARHCHPSYGDASKEWHFFDGWLLQQKGVWDIEKAQVAWEEALPECPAQQAPTHRSILADLTPSNLWYLPYGSDFAMSQASESQLTECASTDLPNTLQRFYGPLAPRLHFIVLMREPLSRLQSSWYQSQYAKERHLPGMADTDGANFQEDLASSLAESDKGKMSMMLWSSMYGRQLQAYLTPFGANQFILIPYKYYIGDTQQEVCNVVAARLGHPLQCSSPDSADSARMHNDHPSLEEEVSPELRTKYADFMAPENELLVNVLVHAYAQGATLPLFHDQEATPANIEQWLTSGW